MRKVSLILAGALVLSTILFGCVKKDEKVKISNLNTNNLATKQKRVEATSNSIDKYVGVYEYKYEHNTSDLIENQYIVLENLNGKLTGRYYGTSDDFDEAREGYLPGFFVANMDGLNISDNKISFSILLKDEDIFTKPIDQNIKSSKEISLDKNPKWINSLRKHDRQYNGELLNSEIKLNTEFGERIFKKIK